MPVMLDEIDLSASASSLPAAADPKFFSPKLTGSGRKVGLLNESLRPINTSANASGVFNDVELRFSQTQNDVSVTQVPIAPIIRRAMCSGGDFSIATPHPDDRFTVPTNSQDWEVFFDMEPQSLVLYEDKSGAVGTKRDLVIQYRMGLVLLRDGHVEPERAVGLGSSSSMAGRDCGAFLEWGTSPITEAEDFIRDNLSRMGITPDLDGLDQWMADYSIYERIARAARAWDSTGIADEVCAYIQEMPASPTKDQINMLAVELRYLENYNVPLEAYRQIHACLASVFQPQTAATLAKQNLNLLMNFTLDGLDRIKPSLAVLGQPSNAAPLDPRLSRQQLAAITTHEPLVMTQAGAGTGKSTTILQRIAYAESCGVPASDITVLSFTNAAADHITELNPKVGSMTIARMIIDIYEMTYPKHRISAIDTILNSIDIYYPTDAFAAGLRSRLQRVEENKVGSFTALNTFVENHFDETVALLDRIGQTSLELQIIICYQKIDVLPEPSHVQSRFLIVDEVQDTSIFEFIYLLKYVAKHKESLYIVGDCSQTLYEFRGSNPRALNTLEGSGVFATYQLSTNYRSNQEILDFANVALGDLETNQFARIQLQANSLDVPTADSFQEKVTVNYYDVPRITSFSQDLGALVHNRVCPEFVQPALDRGEQVAFLAYTRRDVTIIQKALEKKYPDKQIASLVSEKVYATDIFSKYVKFYWNDVMQAKPADAAYVVSQGIRDNMAKLTRNAVSEAVEKAILRTITEWWLANSATIKGWVDLANRGALPSADFFERLRENVLGFEIAKNQQKLNVNKQKNQEAKKKNLESKADLVVSTVHGAKGLEFDNAVILYKEDPKMSQDLKRLYYVAFTRAMKSEYVLAYGTAKNPPIVSSYESIISALTERDERAAKIAAGIDPDEETDQDIQD